MGYYDLTIRRTLADVPRTDVRRPFAEQLRATADVMPSFAIYVALLGTFLITAGDVFFIYESARDHDLAELVLPLLALPFFAGSLLLTVRLAQIKHARRNLRTTRQASLLQAEGCYGYKARTRFITIITQSNASTQGSLA